MPDASNLEQVLEGPPAARSPGPKISAGNSAAAHSQTRSSNLTLVLCVAVAASAQIRASGGLQASTGSGRPRVSCSGALRGLGEPQVA